DAATGMKFPATIQPPSCPPLTLIGLGVRTVSFLRVQVYSIAFYADLSNISGDSFEENIENIIAHSTVAVRIIPVRSTSFSHLRDAFLRTLRGRVQSEKKEGSISASTEDVPLRSIFPNTPLAKGTPLTIHSAPASQDEPRALIFEDLGTVKDNWIATRFFKSYFVEQGGSPAVSPPKSAPPVTTGRITNSSF
ncbi:hypothetical protein DL93DRAFT_2061247, partial [Clavulina sp. PMI_390]